MTNRKEDLIDPRQPKRSSNTGIIPRFRNDPPERGVPGKMGLANSVALEVVVAHRTALGREPVSSPVNIHATGPYHSLEIVGVPEIPHICAPHAMLVK